MERIGQTLLEEIALLPEKDHQYVNMTGVLGMIATEMVARDAHNDCYICKKKADEYQAYLDGGEDPRD